MQYLRFGADLPILFSSYIGTHSVYLRQFWAKAAPQFGEAVVKATITAGQAKTPPEIDEKLGVCPKCGKPLVQRNGKHGAFIGCEGYTMCRYMYDL